MRKDSVNVFSEGLNYDLNPITTPNNVLTDCVNGTFLTFNGDELALQNDAGNTKISYQYSAVQADIFWTLDQAEDVQIDFNWVNLPVEHNKTSSFVTYTENTFQFLYISVPQNSILSLYNELDHILYDSTIADSVPSQLFYLIGTMVTPFGITNSVYRKKDQFNTNNPVLFKIKIFLDNVQDGELQTEYVRLSEGFQPLGMKEEGGVLYIVSGKKPEDNAIKWVGGNNYYLGQFVYNDTLVKTYYESLKNVNGNNLPLETDENWRVIGTIEDFNNLYGLVEVGSYPSPEFAGLSDRDGKDIVYLETTDDHRINQALYNYKTINDEFFKTGRYVSFVRSVLLDTNNVSRYIKVGNEIVWDPKFYNIKLYHQLNNGYLDLTEDVWEKYKSHIGLVMDELYWFENDATFRYYCPTQYKGKLAVNVEVEEIDTFELYGIPTIRFIVGIPDDTFTLEVKVEAKGNTVMDINNVIVTTTIEGQTSILHEDVPVVYDALLYKYIATFTLENIPVSNQDKIIEYKITPRYTYGLDDITTSLPKQYTDQYIIIGRRVISSEYDFKFVEVSGEYECNYVDNTKTSTVVKLIDINGANIDAALQPSVNPFVYVLSGEATPVGAELIANFTVLPNGFPQVVLPPTILGTEIINAFFSTFKVKQYSDLCSGVTLTLNFNMDLDLCSLTIITITQKGVPTMITPTMLNNESKPLNNVEIPIVPNFQVTIAVNRPGFEQINDSFYPTESVSRKYAFIANIVPKYELSGVSTHPYAHFLYWEGILGLLPTIQGLFSYLYYKEGEGYVQMTLTKQKNLLWTDYCFYQSIKRNVKNNNFGTSDLFALDNYGLLTESYNNIPNNSLYGTKPARMYPCGVDCATDPGGTYDDVSIIFRKTIDPKLMLGTTPGGFFINIYVHYMPISIHALGGIGGTLIVDNIANYYPNQAKEFTVIHGPVISGTYAINSGLLVYYYEGQAIDSTLYYKINEGDLNEGYLFNVDVIDSSINVDIYIEAYIQE